MDQQSTPSASFQRKHFLLNWVFIIAILVLFLNDHVFKAAFHNWWTGKLSDFVGMFILPLLLSYFFPRYIKQVIAGSALFFMFWKSPYSQPLIDVYNQVALIEISRVVDYSDLMALSMLPLAYLFIKKLRQKEVWRIDHCQLHPNYILLPAIFILMATSPPPDYHFSFSNETYKCYKCTFNLKMSKAAFLDKLRKHDILAYPDSLFLEDALNNDYHRYIDSSYRYEPIYYKVDELIIEGDSIRQLQFAVREMSEQKIKVYINGLNSNKDWSDEKAWRVLKKHYFKTLKKRMKQK